MKECDFVQFDGFQFCLSEKSEDDTYEGLTNTLAHKCNIK